MTDDLLSRLADVAATSDDLEGLTRPILEMIENLTGLESTYLTRIDFHKRLQHITYSRNTRTLLIPEGLAVNWDDTLCKRALDASKPYVDDVPAVWGDSEAAQALGIKTYLSQPVLNLDGQVYGTLCAASDARVTVPPAALKVLNLFARLIGHQVARERLLDQLRLANEELRSHALTDALTGVANRRALLDALRRALSDSGRDGRSVTVGFVDLDGFKAINDTHGHEVGDRFLIHIAKRLCDGVRRGDLVARYGGDEFVVLARDETPERLQGRLFELTTGPFQSHEVSFEYGGASTGAVCAAAGDTDPEALVQRADAAMYEHKRLRRQGRPRGSV